LLKPRAKAACWYFGPDDSPVAPHDDFSPARCCYHLSRRRGKLRWIFLSSSLQNLRNPPSTRFHIL